MFDYLLGTWAGRGEAMYPTIDLTPYREELSFQDHPGAPRVQYEQKTWRIHADGSESLLHWEFGFLINAEGDALQWINCQNNGRVEVMKGKISWKINAVIIQVRSTAFANDPRMVRSSRYMEVRNTKLHYTQMMSTTTTETPVRQIHLRAELRRAG